MRLHLMPLPVVAVTLLVGCATSPAPAMTVTVTVAPPVASHRPGDSADWDLSAVCAAESEASALTEWRDQQAAAGRLTPAQSATVEQAIAVQYLEMDHSPLPDAVQQDVESLSAASGTLEHPTIDLAAAGVQRAVTHVVQTCHRNGLTIGVVAQGG